MDDALVIGDKVRIKLDSNTWGSQGWFDGIIVRIEPYSAHRSFYWVKLDIDSQAIIGRGIKLVSVLNPRNIQKI